MKPLGRALLMLLSFLLSLWLWLYVQIQEDPPKLAPSSFTVPVQLINKPADLIAVSFPDRTKIFPVGPADEISRIDEKNLSVSIDLSAITRAGTYSLPVKIRSTEDYAVRWVTHPPISITLQERYTKGVPVIVQVSGELPDADWLYLPQSTYTDPSVVTISGPRPDVERVKRARAIVRLGDMKPGGQYSSELELLEDGDRQANKLVESETNQVIIHPAIVVGLQHRMLHVEAEPVGTLPPNLTLKEIQVAPTQVEVKGRSETVQGLGFLLVKVDLSKAGESPTQAVTPELPDDVVLANPVTINARVTTERKAEGLASETPAAAVSPKPKPKPKKRGR